MKKIQKIVPHIVVFLSSMSVMIVELTASRIVSKYFGNSLYTWTGIIGVILGGISLGNYTGGKLADRFEPSRLIRPILIVSGLLVGIILVLDAGLSLVMNGGDPRITWGFLARVLSVIVVLFLLPSSALGTISPVMAKYALLESTAVGTTVGSIYAVSSVGSIVGTFLSGFLLIPLFGIRTILIIVSAVLLALSLFAPGRRTAAPSSLGVILAAGIVAITAVLTAQPLSASDGSRTVIRMQKDTRYSYIAVRDTMDGNTVTERDLIMDGLIHNRTDPRDPDVLLYEYERLFHSLTAFHRDVISGTDATELGLRTLTIGGGALTFPSWLERHFSPADNTVAELDPDVIRTAFDWFDIPKNTRMNIVSADGRAYTRWAAEKGNRYDIVYIDAFSSFSVPYHLTTREFLETVSDVLESDGMVLANCIDILPRGGFLNAFLNSVSAVFPETGVYIGHETPLDDQATFVVAAVKSGKLPMHIPAADPAFEAMRLTETQLADLRERNGPLTLTDSHAPVENLMAPVVLHRVD